MEIERLMIAVKKEKIEKKRLRKNNEDMKLRLWNILEEEGIDNAKLKKSKRELEEKLAQMFSYEKQNQKRNRQQNEGYRKKTL